MKRYLLMALTLIFSSCSQNSEQTPVSGSDLNSANKALLGVAESLKKVAENVRTYQQKMDGADLPKKGRSLLKKAKGIGRPFVDTVQDTACPQSTPFGCVAFVLDASATVLTTAGSNITGAQTNVANSTALAQNSQVSYSNAQSQTVQAQQQFSAVKTEIETLGSNISSTSGVINTNQGNVSNLISTILPLLAVPNPANATVNEIQTLIQSLTTAGTQLQGLVNTAQGQRTQLVGLTSQLEAKRQLLLQTIATLANLKNEVVTSSNGLTPAKTQLENALASLIAIITQIESVRNNIGFRITNLNASADNLHIVIDALIREYGIPQNSWEITQLLSIESSIRVDTTSLEGNIVTLNNVIAEENQLIATANSVLATLQNVQNQLNFIASGMTELIGLQTQLVQDQGNLLQTQQAVLDQQQQALNQASTILLQQQSIHAQLQQLLAMLLIQSNTSTYITKLNEICPGYASNISTQVPIVINTPQQLDQMESGRRYILGQDIHFTSPRQFTDSIKDIEFNGNGYSINGLVGHSIFEEAECVFVHDLTINSPVITGNPFRAGTLAEYLGQAILVNVKVKNATVRGGLVGGLYAHSGRFNELYNVSFTGTLKGINSLEEADIAGGIVGDMSEDAAYIYNIFENVYADVTIKARFAGGIVGQVFGTTTTFNKIDSHLTLLHSPSGQSYGGIIGNLQMYGNHAATITQSRVRLKSFSTTHDTKGSLIGNTELFQKALPQSSGLPLIVETPFLIIKNTYSQASSEDNVPAIPQLGSVRVGSYTGNSGTVNNIIFQDTFWDSSLASGLVERFKFSLCALDSVCSPFGGLSIVELVFNPPLNQSPLSVAGLKNQSYMASRGFDFSTAWQIDEGGFPMPRNIVAPRLGDVNDDGHTDLVDFNEFRNALTTTKWIFDFNGNGIVDLADFASFRSSLGQ